jgi:hypothetical protein
VEELNLLLDTEFEWMTRSASTMARFVGTLQRLDSKWIPLSIEWRLYETSRTWFPYSHKRNTCSTPADR